MVKSEQDQGKCHAPMHDKRWLKTDVEAMTCSDFIKYIVTLAFIRHKKVWCRSAQAQVVN